METWTYRLNRAIAWSFYALFFLTPLIMFPTTFELFEFNKMWFVFGISLIILFLWVAKIIITKEFVIKRAPLDIPILLFLASQIISTVFSLDPQVSFWGYYSRFNGGLLSTITYIFLYYAFASNLIRQRESFDGGAVRIGNVQRHTSNHTSSHTETHNPISYKFLFTSLLSGAVVALWGYPSHFGHDPTCLVFRGSFDVSCWTDAFQPRVRIFSTLGQPNWLAAHLAILLPISIAFLLNTRYKILNTKPPKSVFSIWYLVYGILTVVFYIDLLWSRSQSGFVGFWVGLAIMGALLKLTLLKQHGFRIIQVFKEKKLYLLSGIAIILLIITFFLGTPIGPLNRFTWNELKPKPAPQDTDRPAPQAPKAAVSVGELGGTDSSKIRLIVWNGALEIFRRNPLFGTGVETFAFAYYQVKPKEHNITSEWDYLYNKAHNEFLNYLATTGAFGLGTYLLFIFWFLCTAIKRIFQLSTFSFQLFLGAALIGSFITIHISNFFGFSVVTVNLFLFFIPIFFYDIVAPATLSTKRFFFSQSNESSKQGNPIISAPKMMALVVIGLVVLYLEFLLFRFWEADKAYSMGYNLDKAGQYAEASPYLEQAVTKRPGEALFKDEYASNLSTLALALAQNNQASQGGQVALQAKGISDEVVAKHPNNVVYWKTRTHVLYSLAQLDKKYFPDTITAIEKAAALAPTDAKILYNMGLLYDQVGESEKGLEILDKAIDLKPNYRDAYYVSAVIYTELAKKETNGTKKQEYNAKAKEKLEYILKNLESKDKQAKELLQSLK